MSKAMKITLLAQVLVATFLGSTVLAAPQDTDGSLLSASDETQSQNSYVMSLKAARAYVDRIAQAAQTAAASEAVTDCYKEDALEVFRKFLLDKPFRELSYDLEVPSGDQANQEEILQTFLMLRHLGQDFYPHMYRLINLVKTGEYAKRINAMLQTFRYLDERMIDSLKQFDRAWFEFFSLTDQMEKNDIDDVTGTEVMMGSKMTEFANNNMILKPYYDRRFRSLDSHLKSMQDEKLKKLQDDAEVLVRYQQTAAQALATLKKEFARYSMNQKVAPVFSAFETVLDQVTELNTVIEVCLKDAYSASKPIGKLRLMKDIDSYQSLHSVSDAVKNGTPDYHRRIQTALDKAKRHFMTTAERMNRRHKEYNTRHKTIVWE